MINTMQTKRNDLQGIRGLAILSVLGFHFYPHRFPNGYLGVDQFFVLSGFLMCMLLTRSKKLPMVPLIFEFYKRRFKRILPLYFLFIMVTILALYLVFPDTAVYQNQLSARRALMFVSNRAHSADEDYFEKFSWFCDIGKRLSLAIDLFTHTWSLSVEIQFYFIVPFIFLIAQHKFKGASKHGFYAALAISSLFFHALSSKTVSFNSVFARIWQFLAGMIVYFLSKHSKLVRFELRKDEEKMRLLEENLDEEDQKNPDKTVHIFTKSLVLTAMISVILLPWELNPLTGRFLFTISTGVLMLITVEDWVLNSRFLIYLGDISYALYLIHWPIYAYVRLTYKGYPWILAGALILSILLAVIVYEFYEKWYLKQSNSTILLLIVILLVASGILLCKDEIREVMRKQKTGGGKEIKEVEEVKNVTRKYPIRKYPRLDALTDDMTLDDAARMNAYWHQHDHMAAELQWPICVSRSPEHNWCDFKENGTEFKIAMLGNSYVQNHHKMLIQECKHRAYSFAMDSETGCEPLASPHATVDNKGMGVEWVQACAKKLDEFVAFIEDTKPDYAFILTRFTAIAEPFDIDENHLNTDKIYLEMKKQLRRLLPNIKRKLFMIDSFPRVNRSKLDYIVEELKRNKTMEEINKSLYNPSGFERGRRRLAELVKKECRSKCELINYVDAFWNKTMNAFQYFDAKGFTYFTSGYHLSAHGIEHVRPLYRDICDNL